MEINQFKYSYANSISTSLSSIVDKISDKTLGGYARADLIAGEFFCCLLFPVLVLVLLPLGIFLLTMLIISSYIEKCSSSKLNHAGLSKVPPSVQIPTPLYSNLEWLQNRCKELHLDPDSTFSKMCIKCQKISQLENLDPTDIHERVLSQVYIFLSHIESKLQIGTISKDKESEIFTELSNASNFCNARWLTTATEMYDILHEQAQTAETKILKIFQQYKEGLLLEVEFPGIANIHVQNEVKNRLSKKFGLPQYDDPFLKKDLSEDDIYIIESEFIQKCSNANQITIYIQNKINDLEYDVDYYNFLTNIAQKRGVSSEYVADFIANNFYTDDYQIKFEGVNLMLKEVDILR